MKIGLDFDGVIADYWRLKAESFRRFNNLTDLPEHVRRASLIEGGYLTDEEYTETIRKVCEDEDPGLTIQPIEGAFEHINALSKDHELEIITARHGEGVALVERWLKNHGIALSVTGVGIYTTKRLAAEHLDIFIDDTPDVLRALTGAVPHLFLFSWPYNEGEEVPNTTRVHSWAHFYEEVKKLS